MYDLEWTRRKLSDEDTIYRLSCQLGSITVLDRMTGFGHRDVETGFTDLEGKFWLASGDLDVREADHNSIEGAIQWIKDNANTCVPEKETPECNG